MSDTVPACPDRECDSTEIHSRVTGTDHHCRTDESEKPWKCDRCGLTFESPRERESEGTKTMPTNGNPRQLAQEDFNPDLRGEQA